MNKKIFSLSFTHLIEPKSLTLCGTPVYNQSCQKFIFVISKKLISVTYFIQSIYCLVKHIIIVIANSLLSYSTF